MLMVKKIVLSITAILFACALAFAQNLQVSGTVTEPNGTPVIGATVVVEGTTIGTSTDLQGQFTLSAPTNGTLVVSFIGFEESKIAINGKTTVNVTLLEASKAIDDVIVIAFGEAKKEAFTGSAKVVSSDDLSKTQSTNVSDALVGKVSGMQMSSASGRPGTRQNITIRGVGSVNAGTEPLWVVDGIPYDGASHNSNPADIENISVLKDAASNALYGARGANGVIMVTTKRAKMGDARITFDGKWGLNTRALHTYDYVDNAGEYYELHYRSLYNNYLSGGKSASEAHKLANALLTSNEPGGLGYNVMTVPTGQLLIGTNGRLNPNATEGRRVTITDEKTGETSTFWVQPDDWLNELYHVGFRQEYNINASAASDKANFFASFGYLDNEGIIDGSSNERYTARLRADYQAKKWLKLGGNFSYTNYTWRSGENAEGETGGTNPFATALQTAPIYPIYIRDGKGNHIYDKWGFPVYDLYNGANAGMKRTSAYISNEMQDIQLNQYITGGNAFGASGFAEFRFHEDVKLIINAGTNIDEYRAKTVYNPYYGQFAPEGGYVGVQHGREISYNLQQLINYNHTFNGLHSVDVLVGHEMYDLKSYNVSASKSKMFSYDYTELNGMVVDGQSASSSIGHYNTEGYFVRAQYDYDQRIFASASYRRDASSKFHPDHRWGNFWSLGAAWIISKENWFPQTKVIDMLKAKASYGSQGNDGISSYLYTDYYSISNDGQGGIATIFERKGNPNITWETNGNLNIGAEFSLWQGRLYGNVDYFYRKTTDMLFQLKVAPSLGYSYYYTNIGDMLNQGVELELGGDIIRRKNFVWSAGLNLTHYKNKVTRLPDQYKENTTSDGKVNGYDYGTTFLAEGYSVYEMYMPTYAGVNELGEATWYTYQTDENGQYITDKKGNRNRIVTTDYNHAYQFGRELQGDPTPKVYGGFNTALQFYGVDVSANFTYQIGGMAYDSGYADLMDSPQKTSTGYSYHRDLWNAWTPENKNTDIPRFQYNDQYFASSSSRFLIGASYLNIQNITVGYTLPTNITRKFFVEKMRVYLTCDNVYYWSQRRGLDPRQSISGNTNAYYYAPIRTFSGGVSITF